MPITRTTMIDDDGSGTTGTILNNAWLQTIYNQIDGVTTVEYGVLTLVDNSGAGLVFQSGTKGTYAKWGRIVFIWGQVLYPVTANGSAAKIGGLPYFNRAPVGGSQGFGAARIWWLPEGLKEINPLNPTTSEAITNAGMSAANVVVSAAYLTD